MGHPATPSPCGGGTRRRARGGVPLPLLLVLLVGLAVLAVSSGLPAWAAPSPPPPRVLLINSYDQRMQWVRNITDAVEAAFAAPEARAEVCVENMDTKSVNEPAYYAVFAAMLRAKHGATPPALIICSDDNALNFLLRYRDAVFPGVPVVFCGVNNFSPSRLTGFTGVTGVTEEHYPLETATFLLRAHPGVEELFIINDHTESGRATAEEFARALRPLEGRVRLRWNSDIPLPDLTRQVAALGPETAVLIGVYYSDSRSSVTSYEDAGLRIAAAARVPVYCTLGFNLAGNVVGGKLVTGTTQGHMAAEMGKRILAGQPPESMPVLTGPGDFLFDHWQLRRWRISEASLPPGSEVLNRPFSLYRTYTTEIHAIAVFVAVLAVIIAALAVVMRRKTRTEGELRRLQCQLGNILDSMTSVVVSVTPEGRVLQWNRQAERLSGITAEEATGKPLRAVFPRLAPLLPKVREALKTHAPIVGERLVDTADGMTRHEDVTVFPLSAEGTEGAVIRLDDVTERERVREMMIQTERMFSVGGLAAGMAHEINNPLGGILQAAQNIQRRLEPGLPANRDAAAAEGCSVEQVCDYLQRRGATRMIAGIRDAGMRAARIVTNMLNFSRHSQPTLAPCDIDALLATALELAASDYGFCHGYDFRRIHIDCRSEPDLPQPLCLPAEVEQVVLNLLRNAAQALAGFTPADGSPPTITIRAERHPQGVAVTISDNGPGMPPPVRARVFDPFFTTRSPGEGTGLGLSVAFFIITRTHRGTFSVTSEPGRGASFTFTLPTEGAA